MFTDQFNWDEGTLILMARDILDGNLPYTNLWDIKPPGTYFAIAPFLSFFGESLFAARITVLVFLFVGSILVFSIANIYSDRKVSLLAGILYLLACTHYPSGFSMLSEHLATVPILGVTFLLLKSKSQSPLNWYLIGILIAVMGLFRSNLAVYAVALAPFILLNYKISQESLARVFYVFGGTTLIFAILFFAYRVTGEIEILRLNLFVIPLEYSGSSKGFFQSFGESIVYYFKEIVFDDRSGPYTWVMILGLIAQFKSNILPKRSTHLFIASFVSIFLSITLSGQKSAQYFVQLVPFTILLSVPAFVQISKLTNNLSLKKKALTALVPLAIFLPTVSKQISQTTNTLSHWQEGGGLYRGSGYEVSRFINENLQAPKGFFMDKHIGYIFTDTDLLTRVAHPSNLYRRPKISSIALEREVTLQNEISRVTEHDLDFFVIRANLEKPKSIHQKAIAPLVLSRLKFCRKFEMLYLYTRETTFCN